MTEPSPRAGVIVNPLSGRGNGKGQALADRLRGDSNVSLHVLERFEHLEDVVAGMAREHVTDLFISSGDGTVQAILTQIAERGGFPMLPRIGILPHGTTNLSANDLGFKAHSIEVQADFVRNLSVTTVAKRNTIRCVNPGDGKVRHGMFVGTGAVATATLYCQKALNAKGVKGQRAVAVTLLTAVRKFLFSAPDPADESRFDRPYPITVEADGKRLVDGVQLLQMSTTLDRLALGMRPFWGSRQAPIHTTVLPYPVPSLLRWMLPVMYGSDSRRSPPGAISFSSHSLTVASESIFVIDGEFFPAPQGEPLRLEAGPLFTFMRG